MTKFTQLVPKPNCKAIKEKLMHTITDLLDNYCSTYEVDLDVGYDDDDVAIQSSIIIRSNRDKSDNIRFNFEENYGYDSYCTPEQMDKQMVDIYEDARQSIIQTVISGMCERIFG
jgi:hypothetical protein